MDFHVPEDSERSFINEDSGGFDWIEFRYKLNHQLFFIKQRLFAILSFLLPDNDMTSRLRVKLLRLFGVQAGENCQVRGGIHFQEGFRLTLGDDVFINAKAFCDTAAPITIGDKVRIAFQVTFVTGGHEIGHPDERAGKHREEPITVGDGAWIGGTGNHHARCYNWPWGSRCRWRCCHQRCLARHSCCGNPGKTNSFIRSIG